MESERRMDRLTKFMMGALIVSAIGNIVGITSNYVTKPASAIVQKVNQDEYLDLVIKSQGGKSLVLYGQPDGKFLSLEKIRELEEKL